MLLAQHLRRIHGGFVILSGVRGGRLPQLPHLSSLEEPLNRFKTSTPSISTKRWRKDFPLRLPSQRHPKGQAHTTLDMVASAAYICV